MPKLYKILALFVLFHCTQSHRQGSHRHNYGSNRFNQMADQSAQSAQSAQSSSGENKPEITSSNSTSTSSVYNGDNYIKFTESMHLNFSHSKQFTGLPTNNDPSSFDPFAALRQLLPSMPQNWNSWSQQTQQTLQPQQPLQPFSSTFPNNVPTGNTPFGPNSNNNINKQRNGNGGFNNNYNYNWGGKNVERYGVDLSPNGNSAATTGFSGRRGFKGSTTEKSIPNREDSIEKLNERFPSPNQKQTRPNSSEKSGERLPQRNITAYWIF